MKKIILSIGTRPEIIKMAPLYHSLKAAGAEPLLLHTGQHDEMAIPLYEFFNIKPDINIDLSRPIDIDGAGKVVDLAELGASLFRSISPILTEINPAVVAVHGDTLSALISAECAFYNKIDIAHVEAGLRTHDRYHPFPEEKNREIIARLARWHFAPTPGAKRNLVKEGIKRSDIFMVGNTVVDAANLGIKYLQKLEKKSESFLPPELAPLKLLGANEKIILVTAHRRENQPRNIEMIAKAVKHLLEQYPEFHFVWPLHPNPKIAIAVNNGLKEIDNESKKRLHITKPLQYPLLLWVLKNSWLILTDSGGIQEEGVSVNVPVFVLRETTERPEIIEAGAGKLIGADKNVIIQQVAELYNNNTLYEQMKKAKNPFGNGKAAQKITKVLLNFLDS